MFFFYIFVCSEKVDDRENLTVDLVVVKTMKTYTETVLYIV